jgi:hypothetical protein
VVALILVVLVRDIAVIVCSIIGNIGNYLVAFSHRKQNGLTIGL